MVRAVTPWEERKMFVTIVPEMAAVDRVALVVVRIAALVREVAVPEVVALVVVRAAVVVPELAMPEVVALVLSKARPMSEPL